MKLRSFFCIFVILPACVPSNEDPQITNLAASFSQRTYSVSDIFWHESCCDGSAGIALGNDHFLVANDENCKLYIYKREGGGMPILKLDIRKFLDLKKKNDEADLEGMTRIGSRIFIIASHSRSKDGEKRKGRRQLFALQFHIEGEEISLIPFGKPFTKLLDALEDSHLIEGLDWEKASKQSGENKAAVNVEGLTSTQDGGLIIGFRTPFHKGKTILVELSNPSEVSLGEKPILDSAHLLDLGEMGVRGIERFDDTYVILTEKKGKVYLFFWDGLGMPHHLFVRLPKDINPESIILFSDTGLEEIHLLSDDGNSHIRSDLCNDIKDENERRFRRIIINAKAE